jgi:pimeloyl-ACP methyl ester carboxylesterase
MAELALVLLPGLDGTGTLFQPLLAHLSANLHPIVVAYPTDVPLGYDELLPLVVKALPASAPFVLLGESFSGPLALTVAALSPSRLQGVILCASFIRNPLPPATQLLGCLVRPTCFRFAPKYLRSWALLGNTRLLHCDSFLPKQSMRFDRTCWRIVCERC